MQNKNKFLFSRLFNTIKPVKLYLSFLILLLQSCNSANPKNNFFEADVVVYGGTSAAVIAAVEVSQSGKSVILVSPDLHLGGLTSGGLGWTDTGKKEAIGGLSRNFYHRIWQYYNNDEAWKWQKREDYGGKGQGTKAVDGSKRTMWIFEPHVAEIVFEDYIKEFNIKTFRDEWLNRLSGIQKDNGKIVSFTTKEPDDVLFCN